MCFKIQGYPNSNKSIPHERFTAIVVGYGEIESKIEVDHSGFIKKENLSNDTSINLEVLYVILLIILLCTG